MLLIAAFYLSSTHPSYAYLDPGSGSMVLTTILGVLAATAYTLKGYLRRITELFSGRRSASNIETHDSNIETKK